MTPSPRQRAVYSAWQNSRDNLLIEAVAGSGKTTLLLNLLRMAQRRVLFLAFNKSIKGELQKYIETNKIEHGKAMTLHSLGFMAVRNHFKKVKIDNNKQYDIASAVRNANPEKFKDMGVSERFRMIYMLMDMDDVSRMYLTNNILEIKNFMVSMDKPFYSHKHLKDLWVDYLELRELELRGDNIRIDFNDMIYLPARMGLRINIRPTYLFIDEAQDLNLAQHTLIDNLIAQGDVERWVAVGDRNQAIYGFSGAYASSFDLFKTKGQVQELPLDICYRCPQDIIGEANKVYDVMHGFKQTPGMIGEIDDPIHIKDGSMVVCRNSSPLFELYFYLISKERKVYIKGNDILGKVMSFLRPFKRNRIDYIFTNVTSRISRLEDSTDQMDKFEMYKLQENLDSLRAMVSGGLIKRSDKTELLLTKLKGIFEVQTGGITLCTIHKAKGLEADVVYILNENLIPSKFAKSSSQLTQEENLRYVARTRAKEEMYYLNLK